MYFCCLFAHAQWASSGNSAIHSGLDPLTSSNHQGRALTDSLTGHSALEIYSTETPQVTLECVNLTVKTN